jgi:nucleotide-binding universal stress UspA family protein
MMKNYRRILLATDFSPSAAPGFKEALDVARDSGAELLIAYAYEPPNLDQQAATRPTVFDELSRKDRVEIDAKLEPLLQQAQKQQIKARPLVLTGTPDEAIAEAARKNEVDLIIMGKPRRKGVARAVKGSVASHVISEATCPVMTVPPA